MKQNRTTAFLPFLKPGYILAGAAAIILGALSLISLENYLLFHGVVEIVTIAIAFSIFILVWNNRGTITDTFFLIIGISFLFTGGLDLVHTLAYKGMGVFPESTADLPTQLWIAARYFQSITFLIATLFIGKSITKDRKYDTAIIFAGCTAACGILLASIFVWQDFPACFIEGTGLTPFKIVSEYIISLILIVTVVILYTRRRFFDTEVWRFLVAAGVFLVLGELAFTTYASVYGFTNMLGHLFKLISFYLFYRAIVVVGITRPYDLLFRDLVESINDVIFTMDRQGRIVYISPVISRLFGYNPDMVKGQEFIQLVHQKDRSRFDEWFNKSKKGGYSENEFRIQTHDGRERSVRISINTVVRVGSGGMFTCTLTDITEWMQAEIALLKSEEKFRNIFDWANDAILLHSVTMADVPGRFIDANHAACQMLGYTREELLTMGPNDIVPTELHHQLGEIIRHVATENTFLFETRLLRKDGTIIPVESSGHIVDQDGKKVWLSVIRDITERKKSELALRESEKFLNSVVENIPDMIFVKDAHDLRFVRFNQAGEDLLGFSREELYGKSDYDLFPKEVADWFTKKDRDVLDNRRFMDIPEEKIQTRLKGERILHTKKIPIPDENGQPGFLMGISEDITERRRMENALQLARSKINLLNTVTFQDIQSAVFSVAGYHELLGSLVTDEKAKTFVKKLVAINRKIVDSLNFAKNYEDLGAHPPRWQNIHQVFLLAISHLDFLKIRRNSQAEGLEVYADPLLETVFFHMMKNVLTHSQHATEVTIRYEERPDHLVLFIEDNGVGIPADEKQKIFDRGYGKNTGLGLFLVREVLSITGMTIRETGEPGQGTRLEILVPREGYRFTTGQTPSIGTVSL